MAVLHPPNRIHLASRSPFSPPSCGPQIRRYFAPATIPQYLVSFLLDTTGFPLHNPRHHVRAWCALCPGPPRSLACNTCPATPCSALIPIARPAAIGSGPTSSAASSVLPAAISSVTFRRLSRRTFVCARVLSPPAPRFVPARVSSRGLPDGHRFKLLRTWPLLRSASRNISTFLACKIGTTPPRYCDAKAPFWFTFFLFLFFRVAFPSSFTPRSNSSCSASNRDYPCRPAQLRG